MAMKKLMIIAVLAAAASPALAGSLVASSDCNYSGFYGYNSCRTVWTVIPTRERDREQERLDAIARRNVDAKWEDFCKPTFKADKYGVRRASYVHRGCEFGQSE
jgi:hypothetical protein